MIPVETVTETAFGGPLEAGPDGVEPAYLQDARYRETACRAFYYAVREIPEVQIQVREELPLSRQTIRVFVPELQGEVEERIRDLEDEILARYPASGLDVWISPQRPTRNGKRG